MLHLTIDCTAFGSPNTNTDAVAEQVPIDVDFDTLLDLGAQIAARNFGIDVFSVYNVNSNPSEANCRLCFELEAGPSQQFRLPPLTALSNDQLRASITLLRNNNTGGTTAPQTIITARLTRKQLVLPAFGKAATAAAAAAATAAKPSSPFKKMKTTRPVSPPPKAAPIAQKMEHEHEHEPEHVAETTTTTAIATINSAPTIGPYTDEDRKIRDPETWIRSPSRLNRGPAPYGSINSSINADNVSGLTECGRPPMSHNAPVMPAKWAKKKPTEHHEHHHQEQQKHTGHSDYEPVPRTNSLQGQTVVVQMQFNPPEISVAGNNAEDVIDAVYSATTRDCMSQSQRDPYRKGLPVFEPLSSVRASEPVVQLRLPRTHFDEVWQSWLLVRVLDAVEKLHVWRAHLADSDAEAHRSIAGDQRIQQALRLQQAGGARGTAVEAHAPDKVTSTHRLILVHR